MDYIHIDGLRVSGTHGHYVRERRGTQDFEVSVRVAVDVQKAGTTDKLRHSLNYTNIKTIIEDVFASAPKYLLETLAEDIARKVLKDKRVNEVTVTVKKLAIWKNGVPGVTIIRRRGT